MSIPVWTWRDAIRKSKAPPLTKHVCNCLANHMSDAGKGAWPTVKELLEDTGLGNKAFAKHLATAVEHGLLAVSRKRRRDGTLGRYNYVPRFPKNTVTPQDVDADADGIEVEANQMSEGHLEPDVRGTPSQVSEGHLNNLPSVSPSKIPLPPSGASPKGDRASRLPSNFVVPDAWREWAADEAPKFTALIDHEAAKFTDHWHGNGQRKIDWAATWRNWWRRSVERAPRQFGLLPTSHDRHAEKVREARAIAARIEESYR